MVRVHPAILQGQKLPPDRKNDGIWNRRFKQINDVESYLVDQGTTIVKLFLNVSKDEQRRRFIDRIDEPDKNWKFSAGDVKERAYWDDYQRAFQDMLSHTSSVWAPWHVIPADHKWFSHVSTSAVLLETLRALNPQYPQVNAAAKAELAAARKELVGNEGPAAAQSS